MCGAIELSEFHGYMCHQSPTSVQHKSRSKTTSHDGDIMAAKQWVSDNVSLVLE